MDLKLAEHPARVDHPDPAKRARGIKLEIDGQTVPVFPDERQILLDGKRIGYVGPAPYRGINLLPPMNQKNAPPQLIEKIDELILAEFGTTSQKSYIPPERPEPTPRELAEAEELAEIEADLSEIFNLDK